MKWGPLRDFGGTERVLMPAAGFLGAGSRISLQPACCCPFQACGFHALCCWVWQHQARFFRSHEVLCVGREAVRAVRASPARGLLSPALGHSILAVASGHWALKGLA